MTHANDIKALLALEKKISDIVTIGRQGEELTDEEIVANIMNVIRCTTPQPAMSGGALRALDRIIDAAVDQSAIADFTDDAAIVRTALSLTGELCEALEYAVGLLPGMAGASSHPDNAVYTVMAAKCEIEKARASLALLNRVREG